MPYQRSTRFPELFKPGDGAVWWAFLPNPRGGKRLRESTGHTDAEAAYAWYLNRVRRTDQAPDQKVVLLEHALDDRIEWLKSAWENDDPTRKRLSKETIEFYVKKSRHVARVLGASTSLAEIGHAEIRRYITTRSKETAAGTTIAKELTALSMAWRLAKKDGAELPVFSDLIPDDFAARYVPKTRWLPEDEVDAFLSVLNPKRRPVFAFLIATGATYPSEVAPVRRSHVKGHVVHILGTKATTRDRDVHVPHYGRRLLKIAMTGLGPHGFEPWSNIRDDLHDAARLLSHCPPCRAASLAWARHEVGSTRPGKEPCKACKRVPGVAACSPNDLRRTFAQWLVRSGVPYELAAPMMGHGTTKMLQMVYGRRSAGAVAKLVEAALRLAPKGARQAG